MKVTVGLIILSLAICVCPEPVLAEPRIALVIGNGAYGSSPLSNPTNDADLIAGVLSALSFDVVARKDVNQKTMKELIRNFGNQIRDKKDATGLFYYSGHGMQVDGRNYMIPVGATIRDESDVSIEGVGVDEVLTRMQFAGNAINLILLDACRDNPFEKSFKSASNGLNRIDAPRGTLIAFAAQPNRVALQSSGRYSFFTEALSQEIVKPEISVTDALLSTRVTVVNRTNHKQVPVVEDQLLSKFYFNPGQSPVAIEPLKKEGTGIGLKPGGTAISELTAKDWFDKGYGLRYTDRNDEEAMKAFDKAIEIDPNYALAHAGRAAIHDEWGEYRQGLSESEQAIKLAPGLAWAFHTRGYAYVGLADYQKAIEDLNKAMELDPNYAWPYSTRSWAYFMLKDYQRAIEDANKALEIDPVFSNAYFKRGRALFALNKFQEALRDFDKAIELDPKFSPAFVQRGYTFLKLGQTERAQEDFKKAASMGNKNAQSYLWRKETPRRGRR